MPNIRKPREKCLRWPRKTRAVIYVCEPRSQGSDESSGELSIGRQLIECRCKAAMLNAEIVVEFIERQASLPARPVLDFIVLSADRRKRFDLMIVASLDLLARDTRDAFDIGWSLGFAEIGVTPANGHDEFPWTDEATPS
ncbi:MAG TPA: recombinase family protein [Solirubrobacteraceae bacterium]|nr:recombinase family protein [Solirubrobacteraceae bacterium]